MAARHLLFNISPLINRHSASRVSSVFTKLSRYRSSEVSIVPTQEALRHHVQTVEDPFAPIEENQKAFIDELIPPMKRSFNLAAYVNSSKTLQELVKLGVSLYDIENTNQNASKNLVALDFERDCVPYIRFLVDNGLKEKNLGIFISEFPDIFQVDIDDLQVRLNYLESKGFTKRMISMALNKSSQILVHKVKTIDHKLGELQIEFNLPAPVIRSIISKYPQVISIPSGQYKLIHFCLAEEFGFDTQQMHSILENQPQIIEILRPVLTERLDLIHNIIGLSHETITQFPKLITGPRIEIKNRFLYLKKLKRDQFDHRKPLYVQPSALYNLSDEEFCEKCAKTNLGDYKSFLKSL